MYLFPSRRVYLDMIDCTVAFWSYCPSNYLSSHTLNPQLIFSQNSTLIVPTSFKEATTFIADNEPSSMHSLVCLLLMQGDLLLTHLLYSRSRYMLQISSSNMPIQLELQTLFDSQQLVRLILSASISLYVPILLVTRHIKYNDCYHNLWSCFWFVLWANHSLHNSQLPCDC